MMPDLAASKTSQRKIRRDFNAVEDVLRRVTTDIRNSMVSSKVEREGVFVPSCHCIPLGYSFKYWSYSTQKGCEAV